MTSASISAEPLRSGDVVCSYIIEVSYPGKEPFYVGSFTVPRASTEQETERQAMALSVDALRKFFDDHFPDAVPEPTVVSVRLGSYTFVPDDYDWRRGK